MKESEIEANKIVACAYCPNPSETREHVVPRTMLVNPELGVIVPSCSDCNGRKALDDEYARDVFALRVEVSGMAETERLRKAAYRSSDRGQKLGRNPPVNTLLRTFQSKPVFAPTGDYLGDIGLLEADAERMFSHLKWIVRGLYFHHSLQALPDHYDYQWWSYSGGSENKKRFDAIWDSLPNCDGPYNVGDTLIYKVHRMAEVPEYSQWHMTFYNRLFCIVSVNEGKLDQFLEGLEK